LAVIVKKRRWRIIVALEPLFRGSIEGAKLPRIGEGVMAEGPRKPARPGQMNVFWGVLAMCLIVFFTLKPFAGGFGDTISLIRAIFMWHTVWAIFLSACTFLGGVSLGKLMGGGTKIADTTKFLDTDKV
jgi:hypothetical protein